jgi:hypothetical protein
VSEGKALEMADPPANPITNAMAETFTPERFDVVCAGIPRSGTTMVYRALMGLPPGGTTPRPQQPPVFKTHSFNPQKFVGVRAAVFVFGDPIASVISTRVRRWGVEHFMNCGAEPALDLEATNIFASDILNYEKMFDEWMCRQPFDLIAVRYEAVHAHAGLIAAFLGQQFSLPNRRPRRDYREYASLQQIRFAKKTYRRLSAKIKAAADMSVYTGYG